MCTLVTSAQIQLDARPLKAWSQLIGQPDLWESPFAVVGFRGLALWVTTSDQYVVTLWYLKQLSKQGLDI